MKKIAYRIILAVNILSACSLIVSYLSVHINPDSFALPALFGLAYPYLLLLNVLFVIFWALFPRYEAFISVVVIALGLTHFSNYFRIRKPSGEKTGTFKVESYNLRMFNYYETSNSRSSENQIINHLKEQRPDIIFLQEVYFTGKPEEKIRSIIKSLGGNYFSHSKYISGGRNSYYGIITLSRFPIVKREDIVHPASSSLSIFTDVIIDKDTLRLFNNHLQSFRLQRMEQSFLREITATSDDKETMSEIMTISSSLRSGFKRRAAQAKSVKARINVSPYPVIVAGDFNDTPVSYSYRKIRKGLYDSFVEAGYGAGFTYKGKYPANRIDYILFDNALECRQFDIIKVKYSDHYPIISYFRKKN